MTDIKVEASSVHHTLPSQTERLHTPHPPSRICSIFAKCLPFNCCISSCALQTRGFSIHICSPIKTLCKKISAAFFCFLGLFRGKRSLPQETPEQKTEVPSPPADLPEPTPTNTPTPSADLPEPTSIEETPEQGVENRSLCPDYLGWGEPIERTVLLSEITGDKDPLGIETAVPVPSRDIAERSLYKTLEMLDQRQPGSKTNALQEICSKALRSVQRRAQDWVDSLGLRRTFECGTPTEVAFVEQPNCYRHSVVFENDQMFGLLRLGAMVHNNGFTNLEELSNVEVFSKRVREDLESISDTLRGLEQPPEALLDSIDELSESIQTDLVELSESTIPDLRHLLETVIAELPEENQTDLTSLQTDFDDLIRAVEILLNTEQKLTDMLENRKKPLTELQKRGVRAAIDEILHPKRALIERRFLLEQQMLSLIYQQTRDHLPQKGIFTLWYLALLNPSKKKFEKCGWMHDERHELSDMFAIFKEFDKRKIIFSNKDDAPYISETGTIYLPAPDDIEIGTEVQLNTALINISVQPPPDILSKVPGVQSHDRKAIAFQQRKNREGIEKLNQFIFQQTCSFLDIEPDSADALSRAIQEKREEFQRTDPEKEKQLEPFCDAITTFKGRYNQLSDDNLPIHSSCSDLAIDVAKMLLLSGAPLAMGCLSAKDRAGLIATKTLLSLVAGVFKIEVERIEGSLVEHFANGTYRKFTKESATANGKVQDVERQLNRALSTTSIAMQIVRTNCPNQEFLKTLDIPFRDDPARSFKHIFRFIRAHIGPKKKRAKD